HVLVPPDQLSLAIGREGQNVRLAARLTGWKIDIKNSQEYDQASEDTTVAELISQREEEEALQRDAETRLAAEQATRAEEDARLRELYPLPEDEEEYDQEEPAKTMAEDENASDGQPDDLSSKPDDSSEELSNEESVSVVEEDRAR
ncbi:MAG TPA: transcription elongation factor NusA, partial [Prochlorococcus sp.]|nr:transcription elongation factor NusA [Prochlorococcus sp.]